MRLFKITNPKFTGEVDALYGDNNILKIDFTNAAMPIDVLAAFKRAIPATIQEFLIGKWCGSETQIVEANYEVSLDDFKREYPYKRNTHLLQPIWDRMSVTNKIQAVAAAKKYRKHCDKNKHWYNPLIAATWLNNKEFLNDWDKM
jgi:hypothetical protein